MITYCDAGANKLRQPTGLPTLAEAASGRACGQNVLNFLLGTAEKFPHILAKDPAKPGHHPWAELGNVAV